MTPGIIELEEFQPSEEEYNPLTFQAMRMLGG